MPPDQGDRGSRDGKDKKGFGKIPAPHLHCQIHRCICIDRSQRTPLLLIRDILGGRREVKVVSALETLCGMMLAKIGTMRGSLTVGGEAQCHGGTIGKII